MGRNKALIESLKEYRPGLSEAAEACGRLAAEIIKQQEPLWYNQARNAMTIAKKQKKKFCRRYPWETWFGAGAFTLAQGRDYNGRTYTMAQQIRTMASKLGLRVSIDISDNGKSLTATVVKGGDACTT